MRILLPPSEAKRAGGDRRSALTTSGLGPPSAALVQARARVASALVDFCADPDAAAGLALPARSAAEDLATNRAVLSSTSRLALDRYAGTVYLGLDVATMTAATRRRAVESIVIFSGLFGALGADELVPMYRLPVSAKLPPLGALTAFWRPVLRAELPARLGSELVVDLRSSDYRAMWRPSGSNADQVVGVRILSERPGGGLAVVSYYSKLAKGRLARALVASRRPVTHGAQVAEAWLAIGGRDARIGPDAVVELLA